VQRNQKRADVQGKREKKKKKKGGGKDMTLGEQDPACVDKAAVIFFLGGDRRAVLSVGDKGSGERASGGRKGKGGNKQGRLGKSF